MAKGGSLSPQSCSIAKQRPTLCQWRAYPMMKMLSLWSKSAVGEELQFYRVAMQNRVNLQIYWNMLTRCYVYSVTCVFLWLDVLTGSWRAPAGDRERFTWRVWARCWHGNATSHRWGVHQQRCSRRQRLQWLGLLAPRVVRSLLHHAYTRYKLFSPVFYITLSYITLH